MTVSGILFFVAFIAAIGMALLRHPIYGLYAYIAVFYLHPPSRWWGEFLPDLRWSLLAGVVTLVAIVLRLPKDTNRPPWYSSMAAKLMIAFTAWFWIGTLWALDPSRHIPAAVLLTKYLLVFYMIYRLIDTPGKMTGILMMHVAGCLYLGYLGFVSSGGSSRLDGVGGPGIDDSNTLGMQLATGTVVAAMLVLHLRGWRQFFSVIAIAFALNTVVLTGSRGAFLALVVGGLMLAYLKPRAHRKLFYVFAALGVVLLGIVASDSFWKRMDTVAVAVNDQEEMDSSSRSRIEMFKAQLQMAKRHPFGAGQRGSEIMSAEFLDTAYLTESGGRSSHNVFMTVLVEQGIPGVILFLWLILWTAVTIRRLKRTLIAQEDPERSMQAAGVAGALVVVLIGGIFADFSKCEVQIWMMALLAVLAQSLLPRPASALAYRPVVV